MDIITFFGILYHNSAIKCNGVLLLHKDAPYVEVLSIRVHLKSLENITNCHDWLFCHNNLEIIEHLLAVLTQHPRTILFQ